MKAAMLALLAETPLHPGVGHDDGEVDLPVAREAATGIPRIPPSGVKGAFREQAWQRKYEALAAADPPGSDEACAEAAELEAKQLFGDSDDTYGAACLAFSEARLLLLPVRSLDRVYRWVTCDLLIERFLRFCRLAGLPALDWWRPNLARYEAVVSGTGGKIFLEDLVFDARDPIDEEEGRVDTLREALQPMLGYEKTDSRLAERLTLIGDDAFGELVQRALPVLARNQLDERKVSRQLFYEETLPPDTLLYALVAETRPDSLARLDDLVGDDQPYLRFGGNETLLQGWCRVTRLDRQPQDGQGTDEQ